MDYDEKVKELGEAVEREVAQMEENMAEADTEDRTTAIKEAIEAKKSELEENKQSELQSYGL
jgi:hypothetical protein